jgi:hypothetical protein
MVRTQQVRTFSDLSNPCRRLVRLAQNVSFGRIRLAVQDGEPALDRSWRTRRTVKLAGGEDRARPEAGGADFTLRREHVALCAQLARITNRACVTIEIRHGLPFVIEIEQEHQAA